MKKFLTLISLFWSYSREECLKECLKQFLHNSGDLIFRVSQVPVFERRVYIDLWRSLEKVKTLD
jgi:hypothetical protein